jgi:hypothetical protein
MDSKEYEIPSKLGDTKYLVSGGKTWKPAPSYMGMPPPLVRTSTCALRLSKWPFLISPKIHSHRESDPEAGGATKATQPLHCELECNRMNKKSWIFCYSAIVKTTLSRKSSNSIQRMQAEQTRIHEHFNFVDDQEHKALIFPLSNDFEVHIIEDLYG